MRSIGGSFLRFQDFDHSVRSLSLIAPARASVQRDPDVLLRFELAGVHIAVSLAKTCM